MSRNVLITFWLLFIAGCGAEWFPDTNSSSNAPQTAQQSQNNETPIATDASGKIQVFSISAVETSRTSTDVNYTLTVDLKNGDTNQVIAKVTYESIDAAGTPTIGHLSSVIEPGVRTKWEPKGTRPIANWDAIKTWRVSKVERL